MKAYITKDKQGIVQLWNNKPEFNELMNCWVGWIIKGYNNEVAVDVTANSCLRESVTFETSPKEINI